MKFSKILRNNHFLSILGSLTSAILGFAGFGIISRALTKEENGYFFVFLTLFTFLEMLRTGLLNTGLIKKLAGLKETDRRNALMGAAWYISFWFTLIFAGLSTLFYFFTDIHAERLGYHYFFKWFGLTYLLTLPWHYAGWLLTANSEFYKLFILRIVNLGSYLIMVYICYVWHPTAEGMIISFLVSNAFTSLVCIVMKWCALDTWNKSTAKKRKELLDFGKFSMMTLIGSNLLRSSDTFIIDAFLGSRAVAVYTIPQKLIDIIEIPIRSIVVSALPQLSSLQNEEKHEQFSKVLQQFTGILSLTILPLCLLLFLFAEPLVVLIGGEAYRDSAIILRILAIYTVFLPFDRFTGITFDVLGRPMINTLKVFVMLLVNVGGDIFAIKTAGVGHEVTGVALISIATFFSGVVFGVLFLKRLISFSVLGTLKRGFTDYRIMIQMIRSKVKPH